MIKFSLSRIQQESPYEIIFSEGDFTFVTDLGIHYSISFTEEMPLGGCDTYQFIIRKIDDNTILTDGKHTFLKIFPTLFVVL